MNVAALQTCCWAGALLLAGASLRAQTPSKKPAADGPYFERHVRPILKAHCFQCHGETGTKEGGLDVRWKRFLDVGGDSGPALVAGKPAESLLLARVKNGEMPKGEKKLSPREIAVLEQWIASGARTQRPEPAALDDGPHFTEEDRDWWAFRPVVKPAVPADAAHPVDFFLARGLAAAGLSDSPPADKFTLARRVYFDLLGLPPTPEQAAAFLADERPDAYERLIDELLASPHYGERWGRHWLDVAGYADSEGYNEADVRRESAWRYRDYVVRSIQDDKPFDQFLHEQLAGDEMIGYPREGDLSSSDAEKLVATGFLRMAPDGTAGKSPEVKVARNAVLTETVKIVSSALLGMTVGCAECHDHRYDPVLQQDFYRLRAVFEPALNPERWQEPGKREISLRTAAESAQVKELEREIKKLEAAQQQRLDALQAAILEKELAAFPESERDFGRAAAAAWETARKNKRKPEAELTPEQAKFLFDRPFLKIAASENQLNLFVQRHGQATIDEFQSLVKGHKEAVALVAARIPKHETVRALTEPAGLPAPPTRLFVRGNVDSPGPEVLPGDLLVLANSLTVDLPADDPALATSGRRLAFAKHLTSQRHPLVSRVLVNRFWMHHFGRGLVNTPGDFGAQGERPANPELLDWLASDLMEGGWSLKRFHRLVMTSAAYRQSSARRPEGDRVDASNSLFWRMNVRRLEAETIRDATLAVAGTLNRATGGPPVKTREDENAQVVVGEVEPSPEGLENRRTIYVEQRRSAPAYQLAVFDAPQMEPNCESRSCSTVAPQSLLLLNSAFVATQAERFAERVLKETRGIDRGADDGSSATKFAAPARRAWELAYGSSPSAADLADCIAFLREQTQDLAPIADAPAKALASLCQSLLISNRFLYVD